MEEFNLKQGLILTYNTEEKIKIGKKIIDVKSIYQWLLE